jgi:hypothetical protein
LPGGGYKPNTPEQHPIDPSLLWPLLHLQQVAQQQQQQRAQQNAIARF